MKALKFSLVLTLAAASLFVFTGNAYAYTPINKTTIDTLENGDVRYSYVDAVIEYGWTDPETVKEVTAVVSFDGKKPVLVTLIRKDEFTEEISIRKGVVVKIMDHNGKLIKVISETPKTI